MQRDGTGRARQDRMSAGDVESQNRNGEGSKDLGDVLRWRKFLQRRSSFRTLDHYASANKSSTAPKLRLPLGTGGVRVMDITGRFVGWGVDRGSESSR
jgi:hypothetical protein